MVGGGLKLEISIPSQRIHAKQMGGLINEGGVISSEYGAINLCRKSCFFCIVIIANLHVQYCIRMPNNSSCKEMTMGVESTWEVTYLSDICPVIVE